jgi:hypothetical protein
MQRAVRSLVASIVALLGVVMARGHFPPEQAVLNGDPIAGPDRRWRFPFPGYRRCGACS